MSEISREAVLDRLRNIAGPEGRGDIVSLGLVSEIAISGSRVAFSITVPAARAHALEPMRRAAEQAVAAMPGIERAMVALTAEASGRREAPPAPRPAAQPGAPAVGQGLAQVKAVIAVASGKGGVGKSTTAVNLALALRLEGLAVGVLDADIYGPSVPTLLGLRGKPALAAERVLAPLEGHGLKAMSVGLLVDPDTPMVWRGPMVVGALKQMLTDVAWGTLDVLVVDMPPGTGDVQLSLAQTVPLAGAVIVSTPQDLALLDARKALAMFRKVDVPILGIVENMSYFVCPHCAGRSDVFGHGGARHEAERLEVPFLGEIPLALEIRERSDGGVPVVAADPDGPHAAAYRAAAANLRAALEGRKPKPAPRIVIE